MMRRPIFALLFAALLLPAIPAHADLPPDLEPFITQFLSFCPGTKTSSSPYEQKLPEGMKGTVIELEHSSPWCGGRFLAVTAPNGKIFLGNPWFLQDRKGSIEERISSFGWDNLAETLSVTVGKTKTDEGLLPVTVNETSEYGRVPMVGQVDPAGTMFFPGHFYSRDQAAKERLGYLDDVLARAPHHGAAASPVQVVEFSDFQCPSCKRASTHVWDLVQKYGDRISFHRVDMPLFSHHPWALPAAIMGRAIWMQSPEAFWRYKARIYDNQDELNNFALEDFVRGFVEGENLDLERFNRDIASDQVRDQILEGLGAAMTLEVSATPTFWINGKPVEFGSEGQALDEAIQKALAQNDAAKQ